jgi:hypothetical protein
VVSKIAIATIKLNVSINKKIKMLINLCHFLILVKYKNNNEKVADIGKNNEYCLIGRKKVNVCNK